MNSPSRSNLNFIAQSLRKLAIWTTFVIILWCILELDNNLRLINWINFGSAIFSTICSLIIYSQSPFFWMYKHFCLVNIHQCVHHWTWIKHGEAANSCVQPCWWCEMQQQAVKLRGWSVKGVGIAMDWSLAAAGWGIETVENVIKFPCFLSVVFIFPPTPGCILSDTLITAVKSPI